MSIGYQVGLLGDGGLTREELALAMRAAGITSVNDKHGDNYIEVMLDDGELRQFEAEPDAVQSLERLFSAPAGHVPSDTASAAELCVLLPGECSERFNIARRVEGVPGFYFKSLSVALAELRGHCQEHGENADHAIRCLRDAENLRVGVVFGERAPQ